MITQQRPAVGTGTPLSQSLEDQPTGRPDDMQERAWLWESLRHRFWRPDDLARSMRHVSLEPEQRALATRWWSLLTAADQLGSRMYAAAFVRATEQRHSDQVRWSLLAMLRDEVQHEQLFLLGLECLAPGRPRQVAPGPAKGPAGQHLRKVNREAERYWRCYGEALDRHGIAVVTGGLLLGALVTGDLYSRCASGCMIPPFATAFRHLSRDALRHQGALRALASRDWARLSVVQQAEATAQVQAAARFLRSVLLAPEGDLGAGSTGACGAGLGVPSAEQRMEVLRAALLEVKDLQGRYGVPFPAMPELAIPGGEQVTRNGHEGGERHARR
jgi:hypothetical protein